MLSCHPRHTPLSQECPLPYVTALPPVHPSRYITPRLRSSDTLWLIQLTAVHVMGNDTGVDAQSCYKSRGALNPAGLAHRVITLAFLPCTSPAPEVTQPQRITLNAFNRYQRPIPPSDTKSNPPITNNRHQGGSFFQRWQLHL